MAYFIRALLREWWVLWLGCHMVQMSAASLGDLVYAWDAARAVTAGRDYCMLGATV
jgi:hypothetical protein